MAKKEPQLCPDCPFKFYWDEAKQRIKERGYGLNCSVEISALKVCMEVRRLAAERLVGAYCPHYPRSETLA